MTAREWWRVYYRTQRISRREVLKAAEDMLTWGTGGVLVSVIAGEVVIEHVSPGVFGKTSPEDHGLPSLDEQRERNELLRTELDAAWRGPPWIKG